MLRRSKLFLKYSCSIFWFFKKNYLVQISLKIDIRGHPLIFEWVTFTDPISALSLSGSIRMIFWHISKLSLEVHRKHSLVEIDISCRKVTLTLFPSFASIIFQCINFICKTRYERIIVITYRKRYEACYLA